MMTAKQRKNVSRHQSSVWLGAAVGASLLGSVACGRVIRDGDGTPRGELGAGGTGMDGAGSMAGAGVASSGAGSIAGAGAGPGLVPDISDLCIEEASTMKAANSKSALASSAPRLTIPFDPSIGPIAPPTDPGFRVMHLLNPREYANTARDLVGSTLTADHFPWQAGAWNGFDNDASSLPMSEFVYEEIFRAGSAVADNVLNNSQALGVIFPCQEGDAACVNQSVAELARRAWRRPVDAEDVALFAGVYDTARGLGLDHTAAAAEVVRAFLSSAQFLYRIEFEDPNSPGQRALDSYELASRLSYFLWSSMPDEAAFAGAEQGALLQKEALLAETDRMLADPRAVTLVTAFASQWLRVDRIKTHVPDVGLFPEFTPELRSSMEQEAHAFLAEFLFQDRPWAELLSADINFITTPLAELYGMAPPESDPDVTRVEVTSDERFGFLGLGAFLASTSRPARTSPTLRGTQIISSLLCSPPPAPPPVINIPQDLEVAPTANIRQTLEQHTQDPSCKSCHVLFDGYGLALENFDAIGRYRTAYSNGDPIDASVTVAAEACPAGARISSLEQLVRLLQADPRLEKCAVEKAFTYANGRAPTESDRPYVEQIEAAWRAEPALRSLMRLVVLSDTFRYRSSDAL